MHEAVSEGFAISWNFIEAAWNPYQNSGIFLRILEFSDNSKILESRRQIYSVVDPSAVITLPYLCCF